MPQQPVSSFYSQLNRAIFHGESEKSFVDKLLGRQDADKLHALIQKEPLTLSDVEEILFLMTSIDQKILNYNDWDRYLVVKLFPWVKDFSIVCKTMMMYQVCFEKGDYDDDFKYTSESNPGYDPNVKESKEFILVETGAAWTKNKEECLNIIIEINKYLLHNFKFLISIFLLISNTTLSVNGAAFETLTTSKFEYSYPAVPLPQPQSTGRSIMNFFKK